ncbi:MAG: hypothetical protein GXP37_12890 [Chloroflexi bacterium]|nr:hypothetical protein [Chloroflexota bacterium]
MTTATITLILLAAGLWLLAWRRHDGSHVRGVQAGWHTLRRTLFLLIIAFIIVGYVNVLQPQTLVQNFIGPESGWQGLALGEGLGMLLPGGPYVVFPLIATLYHAGAGLGPAITLISSWAMLGLLSITFELPFMGWRFTAVRWGLGLIFPLLVGAMVALLS